MGRKKSEHPNKDILLQIRITNEDKELIQNLAKIYNVDASKLIRYLIYEATSKVINK